jgi:small subunit ribosomal protein S20
MPNTKSAERRMRDSARKRMRNSAVKSRLHKLEKKFLALIKSGQKQEGVAAFQAVCSALDKAAKTGVIHHATASRKKSRLALRLNAMASA